VPIVVRQRLRGLKASAGFIEEAHERDESQVVSGRTANQQQPKVCGRNAVRYLTLLALHVIRNKPLVARSGKGPEVTPRS